MGVWSCPFQAWLSLVAEAGKSNHGHLEGAAGVPGARAVEILRGGSDGELALMDGVMVLCWGSIGNIKGYDGT